MVVQCSAVVVRKAVPNSSRKFSRASRLVSKHDFQSVFANPSKISHRPFVLLYSRNALAHARLGIIVGKNIHSRAVDRNRIRRVIRESFRAHLTEIPMIDIVIIVKAKMDLKGQALQDEVDQLWVKIIKK